MALDEAAKSQTQKEKGRWGGEEWDRRRNSLDILWPRCVIREDSHAQSSGAPVLSEAVHFLLVIQLHVQLVVETIAAITTQDTAGMKEFYIKSDTRKFHICWIFMEKILYLFPISILFECCTNYVTLVRMWLTFQLNLHNLEPQHVKHKFITSETS